MLPLAIAASFSTTYWGYAALRVAGGLFFPALYQLPFILALELMPPNKRTYTGIVVGMLFATGMCILSLLAYALRDWYHFYYWLIPESPRWLVGRGRIAEAEKKKMKEEEETAEAEMAMLPNINGYVPSLTEKEEYDRRISNMLTFKPDLSKIAETEESKDLERIIAFEVVDIVNKKARKRDSDEDEEECFNPSQNQKATQTDIVKSPNTLRRKSMQLVNKIFIQQNVEEDIMENKKMDDQNSEGDCKASPLDVFRYPNIRKKFFILTFDWVALGVVYNSLSYNTPNLGVDDYLAFFIVFYVLIGELLPTVLRAQAMGAASFISGLGLLAVPYIVHLPLPQTLGDGEMMGRSFKILSCVERQDK
ncbi:Organic cation transporter [Operophtera brumata]|uniref:Organic cation transporter n=1 Tax=Operophtera brumata TaxID=104452 RepID=A0A0L7L043_OPEBR|nr:Organic cation transporter [Operophtera brumata]